MVVHLDIDLDKVEEFDPFSSVRRSSWPNRWLEMVQLKLIEQMKVENEEKLQSTLKHLLGEAKEVKTDLLSVQLSSKYF